MIRTVRFMESCLKCNNTIFKMLSHLALQCNSSYMSKSFNYILSKFKLDAMTFCSMKSNNFYEMVQDHYQEGLDEQLIRKVSFTKDVLESIDNACSTSFFIHIRVALNACCFVYTVAYIHCFNRTAQFLVQINILFMST